MLLCYLDASAWSKRSSGEHGQDAVDVLFSSVGGLERIGLVSSALSYAEVISMIVRFRNRTSVSDADFARILDRIAEDEGRILYLSVPDQAFRHGTDYVIEHSLNATDAALLVVLLDMMNQLPNTEPQIWLIASDKRFLRAATAEGLFCLDPEASSPREIRELLAR